jgi:predicted acyl esterase
MVAAATMAEPPTSNSDPRMKEYLRRYPKADTDGDGVLSRWEYDAHLPPEFFKDIKGTRRSHMLPMRDGVKLATEVFLPEGQGKRPTILIRTGYGRLTVGRYAAKWIAEGCAVVTQDPRGDGASEGNEAVRRSNSFEFEIPDMYDTIDWISKQPWCNGRVGTVGGSGHGMPATLGKWNGHEAFIYSATGNSVGHWMHWQFHNGVRRQTYNWLGSFSRDRSGPGPTTRSWDWRPWRERIRDYAKTQQFIFVMSGGWYDPFLASDLEAFAALQDTGRAYVTISPRGHGGIAGLEPSPKRTRHEQHKTAPRPPDMLQCLREGLPKPGRSVLRYYLMGDVRDDEAPGNVWRNTHVWPVEHEEVRWHLTAKGGLSRAEPSGSGERTFRYDPRDPAPSLGGHYRWSGDASGPFDQRPLLKRKDVILLASDELAEPFIITGPMRASVVLSTSVPDTTIVLKLIDIYPDGYHALVRETAGMARYHEGWAHPPTPVKPGKRYRLELDMGSTAYAFAKGHRLALLITGASDPAYQVHPNSFWPVESLEASPIAETTIYLGRGGTTVTLPKVDDDGY